MLSMLCQGCHQSVCAPPDADRPDLAAMQDYELANGDVEAPAARGAATPSPGMLQYMRSKEAQLGMLSMLLLVRPPLSLSSWCTPESACTSLPSQPQELGAACELMGCLICS